MSLNVEYVFKVLDRFSGPLDRMAGKVNKFNDRIDESTKNLKKLGGSIAKSGAVMSAAFTLPLIMMGKAAIQAASDAEETRSKYATIFKDISDSAELTADTFSKSFGLAGTTARKLLGDTGDMLSGFGFTSEAALKLSKRTNELAVDLASFTNFSGGAEGASAALTKALLGERESVKSLGIAILEEDVKKKVALMRSQGMRFATMREAKAYATLEIAIEQSKNAIGDYARTKKSFANVQRRVSENNRELMESFGRLLIPAATKALNVIDSLQSKMAGLSDKQKTLILIIAGVVGVLGPLITIFGLLLMMLPAMAAGFGLIAAAITVANAAFAAIGALVIWLALEFAKLWDMSGSFLEALGIAALGTVTLLVNLFARLGGVILDTLLSPLKLVLNLLNKVGLKIPSAARDALFFSKKAHEFAIANDQRGSDAIAASAARKSEQRIAVNGTVKGEMTINNNGQKTKAPLTGNLGGQMAGAGAM